MQAQVLNLLADLKSEFDLTYLFISHNLAVVEAVSDRIAVFYFSSVVEIGPAEGVFANPRHPYTKLLADSAPVVGRPLTAPEAKGTELPNPLDPPPGCAFAARCPRATETCRKSVPTLGDREGRRRRSRASNRWAEAQAETSRRIVSMLNRRRASSASGAMKSCS